MNNNMKPHLKKSFSSSDLNKILKEFSNRTESSFAYELLENQNISYKQKIKNYEEIIVNDKLLKNETVESMNVKMSE